MLGGPVLGGMNERRLAGGDVSLLPKVASGEDGG